MIDYALCEVIENGNSTPKTTVVECVEKVIPLTIVEEKAQKRLEVKARRTLMMGFPNEHQLMFNLIKDAKSLLEAIEKRFGETLDQTFDRLQKLVSQLEILGENISQEDVNQKLLRSLSLEWNTHAVVWRNKPELEIMSMHDLYNNIKVYEPEVKGISSSSTNTQNVAFVSLNNINSTIGAVNTAHGATTTSTQATPVISTLIDNLIDVVICAFFASKPNSLQKFGYNAVPPPFTINFMPPKHDLSLSDKPKVVRKNNGAPIIEDWVFDSDEKDVPRAKKEKKTVKSSFAKIEFVKSKEQVKYPRKTTVKQVIMEYLVKIDDPNITMEEYIRLEEEKARRHTIVFNDTLTSEASLSCEPTVISLNNDEIDFRISFDESDDEDCTVIFDKNSFSYKIIYLNNLKTNSENDNDKVNMPLLPSPKPTVSYFDDLDFFKDFENEFPAIVYNDAQTSKSDLLTEPILNPQHIDEFNLKDETSLSECDEEEQNVIFFNDLFPFNVIYPDELKTDTDNDNDKVDIEHSSEDLSVKPLPDLINTDVGAYAHGSNKLLETSINTAYPGEWIWHIDFLYSFRVLYKVEDIATCLVEYVKFWEDWEVDRYGNANLDYYSEDQYAISIKEDTAYPCLHSPMTTEDEDQYAVKIDNPNITMEEYIRIEEEKARRRGKVYNWENATYGKIWDNEDVHDLRSVETEFPAIVFNDTLTSESTLSCDPAVGSLNDEIDFRMSFDESDNEDCKVIFDKNSFSYKIIPVNNLKKDSENDNDKVNMPSLPSPEPTVSCFDDLDFFNDLENEFLAIVYNDAQTSKLDDLDYFKDFENEFSAILYNDAQTSKSYLLTEPIFNPQHIDEFNLNNETSLSECDEEEQNVLYFNDLFPFNVIYSNELKTDTDNDNDKVDIEHSSKDLFVKPLPDLIKTDVGAYAHGSNKLL
ncbi:hypothetical protein Tco_0195119 [Tanacetum coccineum]